MAAPTSSVAQNLPYDVLGQIFILCLPSDSLNQRQPDVTQAPMLLCQICSHWRSVALDTPTIWTNLYHIFNKHPNSNIRDRELGFLCWWRQNAGPVALCLRLSLDARVLQVGDDKRTFLVDFLSSAQYLDLGRSFSMALRDMLGPRPLVCPNLHTLIMRQVTHSRRRDHNQNFISTNINQPIRRLFIEDISINGVDAIAWSHLTHIYASIRITLDWWFSLIRECVNLISGEFHIDITSEEDVFVAPATATLPQLRQLSVSTFGSMITSSIFQSLTLPFLTALRLDHFPPLSIADLHLILSSTPALKELQLAPGNPWDDNTDHFGLPGPNDPVRPLWTVVQNLESIHFAGPETASIMDEPEFVSMALHNPWLELGRAENRIKEVGFEMGMGRTDSEELEELVRQLRPETPGGVELVVRAFDAPSLWSSRKSYDTSLVGCFEDMKFREIL